LKVKYDDLTYRDPTKNNKKHHVPMLTKLELRLYNSIAEELKRTGRSYLRREWIKSKSKKRAVILIGIGRYKPMSDDLQVSFESKSYPLEKVHDLLK